MDKFEASELWVTGSLFLRSLLTITLNKKIRNLDIDLQSGSFSMLELVKKCLKETTSLFLVKPPMIHLLLLILTSDLLVCYLNQKLNNMIQKVMKTMMISKREPKNTTMQSLQMLKKTRKKEIMKIFNLMILLKL